jgi:hypothetical protein
MTVAFLVFILLIAASQLLNSRALAQLTTEHKALVADTGSARSAWPLIAIAVIYGIQALVSHFVGYPSWLIPVFIGALLASTVAFAVSDHRRLVRLGLPPAYLRTARITQFLMLAGLLAIFANLFYTTWSIRRP